MAVLGVTEVVLAAATPIGRFRLAGEVACGVALVVSGVLLGRAARRPGRGLSAGILPGDLALAGALLYLGLAMPPFQQHHTARATAVAQFVTVLAGLVVGCAGLVLSRSPEARAGVAPGRMVRDGVLLITGTILVAIALGQLANPMLMPPKWNWISFTAITIPGMLILVARERLKTRIAPAAVVGSEVVMVAGLAVMLAGSNANLIQGKNGYHTGLIGNSTGLALWLAAAAFLVVARSAWKLAGSPGAPTIGAALYLAGVAPLIYGERAVQLGKDPVFKIGAAFPATAAILAGGVAVVTVMRPATGWLDHRTPA